ARKAPAVRFFVDGSIVCVMRGPNRGKVGTVKRTKMYASLAAGAAGNGVAVLAPFGGGDTFEARADQCTPM
ncbi:MAG: hypothetical protein GWO24_34905, partial [Akkermansiaceae bacterium]|nr:hypothetical protein [Akkermansiaceae bacterium]